MNYIKRIKSMCDPKYLYSKLKNKVTTLKDKLKDKFWRDNTKQRSEEDDGGGVANFPSEEEPHTKPEGEKESIFKFHKNFHDVAFRILLIDDKIGKDKDPKNRFRVIVGSVNENVAAEGSTDEEQSKKAVVVLDEIEIKKCADNCDSCSISGKEPCKLCTIKELMAHNKPKDDEKNKKKISFHYWDQYQINTYYCQTVIQDFIDDENFHFSNIDKYPKRINVYYDDKDKKNGELDIKCNFAPKIDKDNLIVQIVGVRDVRTALLLMSRYKFDMIFCDYLLDYKNENKVERDYIKQLFEFLSHNYKKDIEKENDNDTIKRLEVLEQLRHDVLDNRGPLGKFWIMPITGFNQTFIQDLHRSGINLIDYRWNISNGADPITTPWQFLYHLNKFIELQLRSCVYTMEQLLTFLLYTCQDLNTIEENGTVEFDDFQSFMGSEYATLVRLYGNKFPIKRDAVTKEEEENSGKAQYKSVFATYVWKNFYANQERKYVNEIELYRLMHRFYHRASVMYEDQRGKKLLNDAFADLWFFLNSNYKVREEIKKNTTLEELYKNGEGLSKLKEIVEKCTADKKRDKDKE